TGCQSAANSDAPAAAKETAPVRPVEQIREVTIPAGTTLAVALDDSVGSASSRVDEPVRAHLTRAVSIDGVVALPVGAEGWRAVVIRGCSDSCQLLVNWCGAATDPDVWRLVWGLRRIASHRGGNASQIVRARTGQ